jgi:FlaA1/EpsC-like NDP-sugar epimerase
LSGIVVIPKLKVFKVYELAIAYCQECKVVERQVRKAERVHEFLFSQLELNNCYEDEKYFYIIKNKEPLNVITEKFKINKVAVNQPLSSETGIFFSLSDLRKMITDK